MTAVTSVLVQAVAHEIIGAAYYRFGRMDNSQLPHSPLGVLRAGASRLAKVEGREAGRVLPGGLAAQAQVGCQGACRLVAVPGCKKGSPALTPSAEGAWCCVPCRLRLGQWPAATAARWLTGWRRN